MLEIPIFLQLLKYLVMLLSQSLTNAPCVHLLLFEIDVKFL